GRVRYLSKKFLCQDISGRLNTHGISEFLNPDLDQPTLAHAANPACSVCHYPMDNFGSGLLRWDNYGRYRSRNSNLAYAFGETGYGPSFLGEALVSNGPEFRQCMTKTIY